MTLNLTLPRVTRNRPAPQVAELVRFLEEMEMRSSAAEARRRRRLGMRMGKFG